jgi:hypothetical protein
MWHDIHTKFIKTGSASQKVISGGRERERERHTHTHRDSKMIS